MRILNTAIYDEFLNLVASAKDNVKLCSPFIKSNIVNQIYENVYTGCSISLITNVNLMSYCRKSSDINALGTILQNGGAVYNFQRLHAKIYIFDDKQAIITSANLTQSGLKRNFEYGVLLDEIPLVKNVCEDYSRICNSELVGKLKFEHIQYIQNII
ncbi:MAG: phospholipase D family protein, partial [Syntrophomonadaceae bacterium]|nr:phospholipase D family protein [Syntrophomonadaceae bacterium]